MNNILIDINESTLQSVAKIKIKIKKKGKDLWVKVIV